MPEVRVGFLGPLEVRRRDDEGDATVAITGRLRRLLLCILAANAGHTVPASRLIDALWDEGDEPADPSNTLQQYVAHLRRALGSRSGASAVPAIATNPPGYSIEFPPGTADLTDAASLLSRARNVEAQGDLAETARLAEQAMGMWRGGAFEEFADHRALVPACHALDECRLDAAEIYAGAQIRRGVHSAVLDLLGARQSWRDRRPQLVAAYVTALAHLDRQADALAEAERYRRRLADRGVDVPGHLATLVNEIATSGRPAVRSASGDPAAVALQRLIHVAPAAPEAPSGRHGVDYHLELARAINISAVRTDAVVWLAELRRHHDGFACALDEALELAPDHGLDLALELTLFWDWTGRHDRLRARLEQMLRRLPRSTDRRQADAFGWLAFSWAADDPARATRHLSSAIDSAADPDAVGRVRAVESVITRTADPARSLAAATEAVELLGVHGDLGEAAYAHVVAALAAQEAGVDDRIQGHVAAAAEIYANGGDERGLAWVDAIRARHAGRVSVSAKRFSRAHEDRPTRELAIGAA